MLDLDKHQQANADFADAYDRNADPHVEFKVRTGPTTATGATVTPLAAAELVWKLEGVLKGLDLDNYRKVREMHKLADELAAKPTGRPFAFEMYRRLGLDPETMPPLDRTQ